MSNLSFLEFPLEIHVTIFKYLNIRDLRNVMVTCKTLRDLIINENTIWRSISRNRLIVHNNSQSKFSTLSWYNQVRVSNNWCQGYYRSQVIINHQIKYMPWIKYVNKMLLVSAGSQLRCYPLDKNGIPNCRNETWRLEVPKVQRNDVRTNDISRFVIKNNLIVCGNRDGCVAVYEIDHAMQKPSILAHIRDCHNNGQQEVTAVEVLNNNGQISIVTGSEYNKQLCLWNIPLSSIEENETKSLGKFTLSDGIGIKCLAMNNNNEARVAVGLNGNSKPILLDFTTGQLLMSADNTKSRRAVVRDIGWRDNNTLLYVTHFGAVQLLDIRTNRLVFDSTDPFLSSFYCVKSDGHNAVVAGSAEFSRCVLYDARQSATHVQMFFTQKKSSPVYSLEMSGSHLIAAVDRGVATLSFTVNPASMQCRDYSPAFLYGTPHGPNMGGSIRTISHH